MAASASRYKRSALEASLPSDEAERRRALLRMLVAAEDSDGDDGEEEGEEEEGELEDEEEAPLPALDSNGRVAGYKGVDHRTRSWASALPLDEAQTAALTRDCRLVFALDSSNWLAAGAKPRCSLEAVALAIFERHTARASFDAAASGCECCPSCCGGILAVRAWPHRHGLCAGCGGSHAAQGGRRRDCRTRAAVDGR